MQSKDISPGQRANIVIEVLREQETVSQIATKYGVNPKTLYAWKKEFLENAPKLFSGDERKRSVEKEKEVEQLYQQIGQLQVENNWLKKKSATIGARRSS